MWSFAQTVGQKSDNVVASTKQYQCTHLEMCGLCPEGRAEVLRVVASTKQRPCAHTELSSSVQSSAKSKFCQVKVLPSQSSARSKFCQVKVLPSQSSAKSKFCQVKVLPSQSSAKSKFCQVKALDVV